MKKVVFVCTGNTCRSSMAEGLFRKILKQEGKEKDILVESCGIAAVNGDPASFYAQKVMKDEGIDISSHSARIMTEEFLQSADLILTMTKSHKQYILNMHPKTKGRVFVLGEFADEQIDDDMMDISDPFGGNEGQYKKTVDQIKQRLYAVLKRLEKTRQ